MESLSSWSFLKFWSGHAWIDVQARLHGHEEFLPRRQDIFKALELTPFHEVKVVILGQDPYPTRGHAHGLAFSVQPHIHPLPASLRNVLKEYSSDLGYPAPRNGDLRTWAERGILLLNTILTVEEGKSLSHAGIGWEKLTYEIISELARRDPPVVFLLWGKSAQEYLGAIRETPSTAICMAHPSPLSYDKGFKGSKPFSKANEALKSLKVELVEWRLT